MISPDTSIDIAPFQPADQQAVKELILAGLVEHWGWLDETKNHDLDNIAVTYAQGTFLIARKDGQIIGSGALVLRTANTAEILRMSVAKEWRGKGVGTLLLEKLCLEARRLGFHQVILETTAAWSEVVAFYQNFGFQITHYQDGDAYFALDLKG
ncbi:MAG: GNAT family N-acetyltransferase [Anaerolineales bacterium]|nr:GNAT family N-acetyltransferase [Anaerolineales bacterium]